MKVDALLTIGFDELSQAEARKLEAQLSFVNGQEEPVICFRKNMIAQTYTIPRGAWFLLPDHIRYTDKRVCPPMPKLHFNLDLNAIEKDPRFAGQAEAVATMFREEQGLIIRPPGSGKSAIGTAFAAYAKTRSLILVHTEDILQQWLGYVEQYLPELEGEVGIVRGKKCEIGHVTVATVQTLRRYQKDKEFWLQFGCVIADEAHHVSAPSWEGILNTLPARYRFGFTASPTRADGMHPTMRFIIGPVIHKQKFSSPIKLEVVPVKTNFRAVVRGPFDWAPMLNLLVADEERNAEIARLVDEEVEAGNTVLVLSRRVEHLELIAQALSCHSEVLAAKTRTKKERVKILQDFKDGNLRCLLSTQLADEALDVQRLNRVFLVHPGKFEGRLVQQIGRALRQFEGKEDALIYDFVDDRVSILRRQWNQRRLFYRQTKITIRGEKFQWLTRS